MSPDDKDDLTRIEDITELLHEEDEEFVTLEDLANQDLPELFSEKSEEADFTSAFDNEDAEEVATETTDDLTDEATNEDIDEFSDFTQDTAIGDESSEITDINFDEFIIDSDTNPELTSPELTPLNELTPELVEEISPPEKTEIYQAPKEEVYTPPEQFDEVRKFANTISLGSFSAEGNPPFSIILQNIKYYEDVDIILEILLALKVIKESDKKQAFKNLTRGRFLIPRLSEYAAIILCHRLKKFDLDLMMGLTEEVSPPVHYESNDSGLSSKSSIYANQKSHHNFEKTDQEIEIITSTLSTLEDYDIARYIGVCTENKNLSSQDIFNSPRLEGELKENFPSYKNKKSEHDRVTSENQMALESEYSPEQFSAGPKEHTQVNLEFIYNELVSNMKTTAKLNNANGIIGINFAMTPILADDLYSTSPTYQILATGNMVWLEKN